MRIHRSLCLPAAVMLTIAAGCSGDVVETSQEETLTTENGVLAEHLAFTSGEANRHGQAVVFCGCSRKTHRSPRQSTVSRRT